MKKETLIIHTDTWNILKGLEPEQLGRLFWALMAHQREESLPKMDNVTKMAFDFMAAQVDRDNDKYEKAVERRRAAGRAGAAARWQTHANASEGKQTDAINSLTDTDTDTDTVTDTDTERYVSLAALPPLSPKDEELLRSSAGDRADGLIADVRTYYETHPDKRFPGWPVALAQFDRNQQRWGKAETPKRKKTTEELAEQVFAELEAEGKL